jgi:hypothetical protein
MRKTILALSAAAALTAVASAPASAQTVWGSPATQPYAVATGAIVGTAVGVGLYHGWYGSGALASALPGATVGGAIATGFVAGVGTVAIIDMFTNPCQGLRPLITNTGCAAPVQRVAVRRRG